MGDGDLSDVGWEFGSECDSVAVSGVPVVSDAGETAPSVVAVMCEGVPSDSRWDCVEPQSFAFSKKKRNFTCGKSGRHELGTNACKGSSLALREG